MLPRYHPLEDGVVQGQPAQVRYLGITPADPTLRHGALTLWHTYSLTYLLTLLRTDWLTYSLTYLLTCTLYNDPGQAATPNPNPNPSPEP